MSILNNESERRARQIAAVREVMGWDIDPDDEHEPDIAALAGEIVDAVLAASGMCGQSTGTLFGGDEHLCDLPAGHGGRRHAKSDGMSWVTHEPAHSMPVFVQVPSEGTNQ